MCTYCFVLVPNTSVDNTNLHSLAKVPKSVELRHTSGIMNVVVEGRSIVTE